MSRIALLIYLVPGFNAQCLCESLRAAFSARRPKRLVPDCAPTFTYLSKHRTIPPSGRGKSPSPPVKRRPVIQFYSTPFPSSQHSSSFIMILVPPRPTTRPPATYSAAFLCLKEEIIRDNALEQKKKTPRSTYLETTLSMPSNPMRSTSILGPYEKRTKWWHGLSNRSRRREGLRSKKMPGTTMTFSSRQAWKKLSPSAMLSGRPSRLSHLAFRQFRRHSLWW